MVDRDEPTATDTMLMTEKVPYLDLPAQLRGLRKEIDAALARALDHCTFCLGPDVAQFEKDFAGFCGARDVAERVEAGNLDRESAERLGRARAEAIEALDRALGVASRKLSERLERWLSLLLASDADLVSITLEDLWLEEAPQNVPGRVDLPNWRRRLRYPLDGLPEEVVSRLGAIRRRTAT